MGGPVLCLNSATENGSDAVLELGRHIIWKNCLLSPPISSELLASEGSVWLLFVGLGSVKTGSEGPISSLVLVFLQASTGVGCRELSGAEPVKQVKSRVPAMEDPGQCGSP